MEYMDPDVCCPNKAIKFNHSLTFMLNVSEKKRKCQNIL